METITLMRRSVTEFPIANALPLPILVIGPRREILYANPAAEQFFDTGAAILTKQTLADLLPFGSPMVQLVEQARRAQRPAGGSAGRLLPPPPRALPPQAWRAPCRCDCDALARSVRHLGDCSFRTQPGSAHGPAIDGARRGTFHAR